MNLTKENNAVNGMIKEKKCDLNSKNNQNIYDQVRREEERIEEEKRKLESQQKRLQEKIAKLEKER